ncbi:MAG: hypothetical protein L6Q98_18685 [Anaerolineae bacterium]|nr:hypothetical protein [Anaerolineae bacterium]NUQ03559.1 hypothetical protein [Anaerolineae bacterium]
MTPGSKSESHLHDLLSAVTDAIVSDDRDLDRIVSRYALSRGEIEGFLRLIQGLHVTLVGVQPSRRFAQRLKTDLLGAHQGGVIQRVRYLPPRVQIAAGVALLAGFMLLSRRRLRLADGNEISVAS